MIDTSGNIVSLKPEGLPNDFHEVIGARLPNEFYYLMSQGYINPQVANNLLSGSLFEAPPLADSEQYHQTIAQLLPMRAKMLNMLASSFPNFPKEKQIVSILICWLWHYLTSFKKNIRKQL